MEFLTVTILTIVQSSIYKLRMCCYAFSALKNLNETKGHKINYQFSQ